MVYRLYADIRFLPLRATTFPINDETFVSAGLKVASEGPPFLPLAN
jgi:hypothetical protein